jgi:hypothetical protein
MYTKRLSAGLDVSLGLCIDMISSGDKTVVSEKYVFLGSFFVGLLSLNIL